MNRESANPTWGEVAEGAPRECLAACLITDAERYTGLTETMEPTAVVGLINRYFGSLFAPVLENGGVISDVKGDGVLAVWNHESAGAHFKAQACAACLEIVAAVEVFNRQHFSGRLPTRLGLDFGPVAIARVGAHARYEYRAVGDPVNTASRLEALNKVLRTRVLVSEALAQGVDGFLFRDLGSFHLRGKHLRTRVKELLGRAERCSLREHEQCRDFAQAVAAYELGDAEKARKRFRALQSRLPEDGPTRYYLQRLESEAAAGAAYARPGWLTQLWRSA